MNRSQRFALIALACAKLGTSAKVCAVLQPTRHDLREEISLVNTAERGQLENDFADMPASKALVSAFEQ